MENVKEIRFDLQLWNALDAIQLVTISLEGLINVTALIAIPVFTVIQSFALYTFVDENFADPKSFFLILLRMDSPFIFTCVNA